MKVIPVRRDVKINLNESRALNWHERGEHVTQLIQRCVVPDLQGQSGPQLAQQVAVAREQDAALGIGPAHQVAVMQGGIGGGVETEHAQPARQASEHGIGQEAGTRDLRQFFRHFHPTRADKCLALPALPALPSTRHI